MAQAEIKPYTIYGSAFSTCTRTAAVALQELNIPYKIIDVNFAIMEHKSLDYLENKQPFGQIPVLVEDDFTLFESRAIARYLIDKHDPEGRLIPRGQREKALFEQAMSIESNDFYPYALSIATEKFFKPFRKQEGDEAKAEGARASLYEKLDGYERILSKTRYLAGNQLTFADLAHLPYATLITEVPECSFTGFTDEKKWPSVARWYKELTEIESWKTVQKPFYEFYAQITGKSYN